MRIIAFTSSNGLSGGVQQALYQTRGLRALGHDAVLCAAEGADLLGMTQYRDCLHCLPAKDSQWKAELEKLMGQGPAIVHAFHNRALKLAALWGMGWKKRGVVTVAHRGIITRPKNPLPYLSPGLRLVLPNSKACAKSLRWHCPPWKIRVLPNGVAPERIQPTPPPEQVLAELGLDAEGLKLIYVGNDNPVKGAALLLETFHQIAPELPGVSLILVGLGLERLNLQIPESFLRERVRVVNHTPYVSNYLQLAQALVFPSWGLDSAPNVLLEASLFGLPVISTDVGGAPEIVDGNGPIVPARNKEALAQAIKIMCLDREQRERWAAHSHIVAQRFSMETRCRNLEDIYADLLAEGARG